MLHGENSKQDDVDDNRRGERRRLSAVDALRHDDIADEANGVEERGQEDDVGGNPCSLLLADWLTNRLRPVLLRISANFRPFLSSLLLACHYF